MSKKIISKEQLPEGRIKIRFGHFILYNSLVTPPTCYCLDCGKHFNTFQDVPKEDCPGKHNSKPSVSK